MQRLMWAAVGIAGLFISLSAVEAQAQTPSKPNPNLPSFVTNPWGNPVLSYYQRQREMREQRALQQSITQLQRLEVLKSRGKSGKTSEEESDGTPKPSFHLPKAGTAPAKVPSGKTKPMKPADGSAGTASEPPEIMDKIPDGRKKQVGGNAKTYSNGYKALVPGRQ